MLRFDRFLVLRSRAIDLASGNVVELDRSSPVPAAPRTLFDSSDGRTLIDLEAAGPACIEVWERWTPRGVPRQLAEHLTNFIELLECARHGAPRALDVPTARAAEGEYLRRALAREARVRGWIPIALELLAALSQRRSRRWPSWLAERSLVVFAETDGISGDALLALLRLAQRDIRPHVLVRNLTTARRPAWPFPLVKRGSSPTVHEEKARYGDTVHERAISASDLPAEAAARWALLIEESTNGEAEAARALDLADVLAGRDQPFEARALAARASEGSSTDGDERRRQLVDRLDRQARVRSGEQRGWEMVDDFVGVLQLCQEVEDESTTLARVGAFVRERLQATAVAFVGREGTASRVLSRVGSEVAGVDLAFRSMDAGIAIPASRDRGPVESAFPVRHAAEVIGALWCRWGAGTPVAPQQATTLLGIAAAAAAPSVRLALARIQPQEVSNPVPELVGRSDAIRAVREAILRAAASPFPVLIEGESGSGKELAARAIHSRSPRRTKRFCAINCAALVDDLVEAELFGHVRGAFTGAHGDRAGVFEEASGGTLFLDEVSELGARVQAKLLRTLQESEIRRLGETLVRKVDVRIVAASNRPLAEQVRAGAFRQDLWYRLDVVRVVIPPLRSRLEDLPELVAHLWQTLASRTGSRSALSPATIAALARYDWPGNVRELQNVLASLMVSASRPGLIGPSALPAHIGRAAALESTATLEDARRQFEERYVRAALARAGGSPVAAARLLGLTRQGMSKLLTRLNLHERR